MRNQTKRRSLSIATRSKAMCPAREVPAHVYTFWHESEPPELVASCIDLLRRTAEAAMWEVTVLSSACTQDLPPPPVPQSSALTASQQSDWYRLAALAQRGGVYLDASCICLTSPDAWVDRRSDALQGFLFHPDGETMDSWAIAAPPCCALVARWRDEFGEALRRGVEAYCREKEAEGHSTAALSSSLPYLTIHLCFRVARASLPASPLRLLSAVAPGAPLHYLRAHGWEPLDAVSALFAATADELGHTPLIKLRACDRECVAPLHALGRGSWLARQLRPSLGVNSRVDWLLSR